MDVRYHAFLDESGQREYGEKTDPYYVVAGAIAPYDQVSLLEAELGGLKRAFFRTPEVEVKSNWLRQPAERMAHYLEPYGITENRLTSFVDHLYDWILSSPLVLIAGIVDKPLMLKQYSNAHHPSAVAYLVFVQRYQKYLASRHSVGAITCDILAGASAAGNEWQKLLEAQHRRLKKHGCPYTGAKFPNLADTVSFNDSANSSLIQVADLVAYNTFRQFRDYGSQWDDPARESLELYEYFERMLPRVHKSPTGVFGGFGVVKMPSRHHRRWVIESAP